MQNQLLQHILSEQPRIMVVDGSKLVRKMLAQVLKVELPEAEVLVCETGEEAKRKLDEGLVDFVTTALTLPDMDGVDLARYIREQAPQAYIPIVVVSGSVDERLIERGFTADITDYFDKSLGFGALAQFIKGYVSPQSNVQGEVLYVEDSKVVALATRRMLEKHGFHVNHVSSVDDALAIIKAAREKSQPPADIVLTDVYLKGGLTGKELLEQIRGELGYARGHLPVLIMTADDNPKKQAALLRAGANDLVRKPVEEKLLVTKLIFQLKVAQQRPKPIA